MLTCTLKFHYYSRYDSTNLMQVMIRLRNLLLIKSGVGYCGISLVLGVFFGHVNNTFIGSRVL